MRLANIVSRVPVLALVLALAGCASTFKTSYDATVDQAKNWRVVDVDVTVPTSLVVTEESSFVPGADILWQEQDRGNRYEQVDAIVTEGIRRGSAGLHGSRPVRLVATVSRFHALTFTAEQRAPQGVHTVIFDIAVYDAKTGALLEGPDHIEASFPAMVGAQMARARAQGQTQQSQITNHIARTVAGWLGLGPDPRMTFSSLGA